MDDAGPWACTPAADVRRLIEYCPTKLCVVRGTGGAAWRLLVEQEGGRWSAARDEAAVGTLHMESALDWQRRVSEEAMKGNPRVDAEHARECTKWAVTSAKAQGVRDLLNVVGATVGLLEARGMLPEALTVCADFDLDANRHSLGAPNGIIDLKTGKLLPAEVARARFITRHVPDAYDPAALHPYADGLVDHLTEQDKEFLMSAFGFALHGNPARRINALVGHKGGAKSTLFNAVVAALGDVKRNGYAMRLDVGAILHTRWAASGNAHQGNLYGVQDARLVVTEEPPLGARFNGSLLKDLSGGLTQHLRDVGEKAGPSRPAQGTLFSGVESRSRRFLGHVRRSIE